MSTAEGLAALRRVLLAFSAHSPRIGYCQSMNFLAAALLLALGRAEDSAFWVLVCLIDDGGGPSISDKTHLCFKNPASHAAAVPSSLHLNAGSCKKIYAAHQISCWSWAVQRAMPSEFHSLCLMDDGGVPWLAIFVLSCHASGAILCTQKLAEREGTGVHSIGHLHLDSGAMPWAGVLYQDTYARDLTGAHVEMRSLEVQFAPCPSLTHLALPAPGPVTS